MTKNRKKNRKTIANVESLCCRECGRQYDIEDADAITEDGCDAEDCPSNVEKKGLVWNGVEAVAPTGRR